MGLLIVSRSNNVLQLDVDSLYHFCFRFPSHLRRVCTMKKPESSKILTVPSLSDIFGRRRFVICGCFVSLVGTAIALASQNVPMMIAAMALKGIGSGSQQLALAAIAEIVPNKHRGTAQAALDIVTLPWAVFGSLTGNAMVKYYALGFRINFIIGAILNVLSITTIWMWYHPVSCSLKQFRPSLTYLAASRNSNHRKNSMGKSQKP
jgi:MFS family permease